MESRSTARYMSMSSSKVRPVLNLIRDKNVEEAYQILRLNRGRAARMIEKVLHAAVATAVEQHDATAENLMVSGVWVDGGPTRRTRMPRARGMSTPIIHRTCHINVVVSDETGDTQAGDA